MSKIKTVIIAAELIPQTNLAFLPKLMEFLELLPLDKFTHLSINWDTSINRMQPLDSSWVDTVKALNFKYLNETLYICTGHTTPISVNMAEMFQYPKITFDDEMAMLDVQSVRDQLVELCALARKELINEFEFKWITHANFKTDIEGAKHLEHFIKAMELPTNWESGTPYKVTIAYNRNMLEVGAMDDLLRIKTCPILRTKLFHRLKCQVDRMMDNLKILGVSDIDLIWSTRDSKIMVNSISLNTDDIYTDTRVMQAQAILNLALDSIRDEDFPEKVNITMNPNQIQLTAI